MANLGSFPVAENTTLVDSVSTSVTYVGVAKLGSDEATAVWQIRKLTTTGTVTKIQYANGSRRFNQIWNDRASLTYSN